jgi:hypothetical protein
MNLCNDRRLTRPERVSEGVPAGRLSDHEFRCEERTLSEQVARAGAVGELEALALAEKEYGVIADDVAAAHTEDAELVRLAGADVARPLMELGELGASGARGVRESARGTARSVDFLSMMKLDDLHVERGAETTHRLFHDLGENLNAKTHVGREEDGH